MTVEVAVPPLGESVSEATVAKWHKKISEAVTTDELLVELETDKVTLEVNAPASGVLAEILVDEGASVEVGNILGKIASGDVPTVTSVASTTTSTTAESAKKVEASIPSVKSSANKIQDHASVVSSPAATKIAAEKNIDTSTIEGSGKDGRITKGDVLVPKVASSSISSGGGIVDNAMRENRVKMTRLRQTIAKRLKDSQNTAAILTTFNEVDVSEIMRIRKRYQEKFVEAHGTKLGFMSFFVKAAVRALQQLPAINAQIEGNEIIYKNYYDIGVAVGTPQGLVVPILRDADKLSFAAIESGIAALGKKAKEGKLAMEEMMGGTFSITNGGVYGSLFSTPIINPPQSGILGMHNIVERPVAVKGEVVIRPMMYIALSYDHRIVDGKEAVTFLVKIKELIEDPEKMLFDL